MHALGNSTESESAFFSSTKGHPVSSVGSVIIDHDCGGIELRCAVVGCIEVVGKDSSLEGVWKAIGLGNCFIDISI